MSELAKDVVDNLKTIVGVDKQQTGVYLATPTGKFMEEDPTYIEVKIGLQSYFAKPCFSFGSWNIPSEKWLEKNRDKVMVWVAFENGDTAHPVYLGIQPLDGKKPEGMPYKNGKNYATTKFKYWFDDDTEEFYLEQFDDSGTKQNIKLSNTGIEIKRGELSSVEVTDTGINLICGGNALSVTPSAITAPCPNITFGAGGSPAIKGDVLIDTLVEVLSSIASDTLVVAGTTATHSPALATKMATLKQQLMLGLSNEMKIG